MDKTQYEEVKAALRIPQPGVTISAEEFAEGGDRTLLYGYTLERDTFHVYIKGGKIFAYTYRRSLASSGVLTDPHEIRRVAVTGGRVIEAKHTIPSKRCYPEHTDAAFALRLIELGFNPNMTTYNDETAKREPYAGEIWS